MNTSCLGDTDNRICWMNTESVVCARGAGARLLRCSGVPAVASVSPVWPRWRVDTGLHTPGIWRPAARPATSVISSLSRSHTVNWRCGAGHGVCSYRDTVTSVVVCTSVSCRVGHPGTVGLPISIPYHIAEKLWFWSLTITSSHAYGDKIRSKAVWGTIQLLYKQLSIL